MILARRYSFGTRFALAQITKIRGNIIFYMFEDFPHLGIKAIDIQKHPQFLRKLDEESEQNNLRKVFGDQFRIALKNMDNDLHIMK